MLRQRRGHRRRSSAAQRAQRRSSGVGLPPDEVASPTAVSANREQSQKSPRSKVSRDFVKTTKDSEISKIHTQVLAAHTTLISGQSGQSPNRVAMNGSTASTEP